MDGVLNFLKPPGMTSHDAVAFVRRIAGQKRVGHTGTLDPAAAGVLPICLGHATRLVEYLQAGRKTYIAELTFGIETDSHDAMGNVVSESDASGVTLEKLREVLNDFRGTISQTPPIFSAIKKDGKKLYEMARSGIEESEIEIAPREVEIHSLFATRFFAASTRPRATLKIECGSGTYVRSLARDIGRALGCGATMTFLVRSQNGSFAVNDALTPEGFATRGVAAATDIREVLTWCARLVIENDEAAWQLSQGRVLSPEQIETALRANTFYENQAEAPHQHRGAAFAGNVAAHRALFFNAARDLAVLAQPSGEVAPIFYQPEKVFFLNRDD